MKSGTETVDVVVIPRHPASAVSTAGSTAMVTNSKEDDTFMNFAFFVRCIVRVATEQITS